MNHVIGVRAYHCGIGLNVSMFAWFHTGVSVTVAGQVPLHGPAPPDTVPLVQVSGNRQLILPIPVGAA
jgi:hypothetical protein